MYRRNCLLAAGLVLFWVAAAAGQTIPRINKDDLKSKLGSPNLVIVDARIAKDWAASDQKIKGALRGDPERVGEWAARIPQDREIVVYCA
jgi:rhodanese-related sulfurtransferase